MSQACQIIDCHQPPSPETRPLGQCGNDILRAPIAESDQMNYGLIFDVAASGYRNWALPAFGLIFVAVGTFLVKNRTILPYMFPGQTVPKDGIRLGVFFLICSVLWIGITFGGTWRDYSALRNALKEGNVDVIEGRVENFVSIPHKTERFSVCGVAFSYSNYGVVAGFNNTNSFGGPLREKERGCGSRIWATASPA